MTPEVWQSLRFEHSDGAFSNAASQCPFDAF